MSVDQAIHVLALELNSIGARSACDLLEANVQVGGREFSLLVSLTLEGHLVRSFHSWLHHYCDTSFLLLNCSSVKAEHVLLIVDLLAGSVVHLLKSHIDSDRDILGRLRLGLIQTSVGRAKVTAFDLEVGSGDLSKISAQVKERVRLEEKLVEDGVAVLLVLIATSEDAIRSADT